LIKPKKRLGQNFLADRQVIRKIIDAASIEPADVVVEIGPGMGALTESLMRRAAYVVAIETDSRLVRELRRRLTSEKLTVLEADALELDWSATLDSASESRGRVHGSGCSDLSQGRIRVIANLPYYISTPIVQRLIAQHDRLFDMILMLQDEVVDRIISAPGHREYGYLSVLVQYYCEAAKLFEVAPSAFKPAPKVRSAVVRLMFRREAPVEVGSEPRFFALVRAAFAHRRKTLLNNLRSAESVLGFTERPELALASANIDPRRRAETLSLADFALLLHALYPQ